MKKDLQKIKIIFMGTPEFSKTILESLLENKYNIISVYTQGDKKVGRKRELQKSPVKILAEKNNIPVFTPEKLKAEVENIQNQNPDLIIVAAYGKIIPQEILDIPKYNAINIHPSLLPKYRGASPIQNTLLNGDEMTGTTIMLMSKEVDAGDILKQITIDIDLNDKLPELSEMLAEKSAELLLETLPDWINNKIEPQKQDPQKATFCQMLNKDDGKINWDESVEKIFNRFRAFYPWPGVFTFWNGQRIKLNKIRLGEVSSHAESCGKIFETDEGIAVQTKNGIIILEEIQLEGKNNVIAKNFANGYPDFIGSIFC